MADSEMTDEDTPQEIPEGFEISKEEIALAKELTNRRVRLTNMTKQEKGIVEAAVECHESWASMKWVQKLILVSWTVAGGSFMAMIWLIWNRPEDEFVGALLGNVVTGFWTSALLVAFISFLEGGIKRRVHRERVKLFALRFREDFQDWFSEYYSLMEWTARASDYLRRGGFDLKDNPEELTTTITKHNVPVLKIQYEKVVSSPDDGGSGDKVQ